jgi:uncharacterized delta-60 repeat protein
MNRGVSGSVRRSDSEARLRLEPLQAREVPAVIGDLDPTFGTAGTVGPLLGTGNDGQDVVVDSVGRTVIVGDATGTGGHDFLVLRLNQDGTPDTSFGTNGKQVVDFAGNDDFATAVAVDAKDDVIVAGTSTPTAAGSTSEMAFARLTASNGVLDPTFGTGGTKLLANGVGANVSVAGMTLDAAGNIVAIGRHVVPPSTGFYAVVRLLANGSAIDPSFNGGAIKLVSSPAGNDDFGQGVAVDGKGDIVGAGFSIGATTTKIGVFRLQSSGTLDPSFNGAAVRLITAVPNTNDSAHRVGVDAANNVYVVGDAVAGVNSKLVVAKVLADGSGLPGSPRPATTSPSSN